MVLREPREDDVAALFAFTSDPEVTRFLAITPPVTPDDTLYFIAKCREHRTQDREYVFTIAGMGDDRAIGIIGLRHLDPPMRTAQVGTWLGRQHWGTGVNVEAKSLLLDFAFDTLSLHRVEARIAVDNARSRRAFERLGATCEGLLRESFYKDGAYYDQQLYVVLAQDWQRARRMGGGRRLRSAGKDGSHD
ncbi:MAG TPA: GNAT family N-acetyltransferase [Vicinamibacterales bacterium]